MATQKSALQIPFLELTPELLKQNLSIGLFGARRSGKSTLIKYIYKFYLKSIVDITVVYTLSDKTKQYYENFIINHSAQISNIHCAAPPDDLLDRIDEIQRGLQREGRKPLKFLVILDDCVENQTRYNEMLTQIFIRGRHSEITIIFASQHYGMFANSWRANLDLMLVGQCRAGNVRDIFAKNYLCDYDLKTARAIIGAAVDHKFIAIPINAPLDAPVYIMRADI